MAYRCPLCSQTFYTATALNTHRDTRHSSSRQDSYSRSSSDDTFGWATAATAAMLVDSFSSGSTDYGSSSDWSGGGGDSGGGGASGDW